MGLTACCCCVLPPLLLCLTSVGSDYDFTKEEDRDYWQDCCGDAEAQSVTDSECQKPQW